MDVQVNRSWTCPILGTTRRSPTSIARRARTMNASILTAFGLNIAMALMAVAWLVGRRIGNVGCLDVAAAGGFALLVCFYASVGTGDSLRKWLLAAMVTIWSLRLAVVLLLHVGRNHPQEPRRYLTLRENFPKRPWLMLFGFSQYLAALVGVFSVPFAIACSNPAFGLRSVEIVAAMLWVVAMCASTVTSEPFKRWLPARKGSMLAPDANFSRYSLRASYFSEWLAWFAYFLFALGSPWGWITFYCPLLMFYSLTTANTLFPRPPEDAIESRSPTSRDA
jgi:steroid 5-alpha reductase family enzyme